MGDYMRLWAEVRTDKGWQEDPRFEEVSVQDYDIFAIMAGVRNHHGYDPIFSPRGQPPDYTNDFGQFDSGLWSESWMTVAEIMAYDWTQSVKKHGLITGNYLAYWVRHNLPNGEPPQDVTVIREEEELLQRAMECRRLEVVLAEIDAWERQHSPVFKPLPSNLANETVLVSWQEPYYVAGEYLLSRLMPKLWRLGKPDDVRIVFGFH